MRVRVRVRVRVRGRGRGRGCRRGRAAAHGGEVVFGEADRGDGKGDTAAEAGEPHEELVAGADGWQGGAVRLAHGVGHPGADVNVQPADLSRGGAGGAEWVGVGVGGSGWE